MFKNYFINILILSIILVIGFSFYNFYYKKNFDFHVETHCNHETEICFYRDCEGSPDSCPPNELSYYSIYIVNGSDFNKCENEDCTNACLNRDIKCKQIGCTKDDIDTGSCVLPESNNVEETENNN